MHARRLIRRHFAEGLPEAALRRLRAHLRDCPRCRAEYDGCAALLRAAAGHAPTRAEGSRVRAAALAAVASGPAPGAGAAAVRSQRLPRLAPVLGAGLLLVVSALLARVQPPEAAEPASSLKGGAAGPLVDLQVFAVRDAGGVSAARLVPDGGGLRLDELIQFRYLSADPQVRHLYLLGVDERVQPIDYYPRPEASRSLTVRSALEMTPVERSIRLSKRHAPGQLWIYALFSRRPLERQGVHARLAQLRIKGTRAAFMGKIDWGKDVMPVVRRFEVKR